MPNYVHPTEVDELRTNLETFNEYVRDRLAENSGSWPNIANLCGISIDRLRHFRHRRLLWLQMWELFRLDAALAFRPMPPIEPNPPSENRYAQQRAKKASENSNPNPR